MRDLPNQTMGSTGTEATVRPEEWLLARAIAAMVGHHSLGLVPARPLESRHWEGALRLAAFHRLVPVLYYASQSGDSLPQVPAGVLPVLKREHHATLARNLLLRAHLQQLLQAFQERDIPVIVLKGVVLDELYPQPGLRSFGDIDLLMRPADLPQGEELLRSLGFSPAGQPRAQEAYRRHHHHLVPYDHERTGTRVELHKHIVRPDSPYSVDITTLWEHAQPAFLNGVRYLKLAPEDQILHLCLHFLIDRQGLRPGALLQLCDIALVLTHHGQRVSWEPFTLRLLNNSLGSPIYTALYAARLATGTPLPQVVESTLRPAGFDEANARLFVFRRVFACSSEIPGSLVGAMAASGVSRKVRGLARALLPPDGWTPGGGLRLTRPSIRNGVRFLLRPIYVVRHIGNLLLHGSQLWEQVRVERWLHQQSRAGGAGSKPGSNAADL